MKSLSRGRLALFPERERIVKKVQIPPSSVVEKRSSWRTTGPQVYRCTAVLLLLYAVVVDWSVRAAPLLLCCCCTAVMVGCDRPSRSVPSLSRRHVPAFLSYRVRVVLLVLPSSGRSPPRRLATPSCFSVKRSCLATPPSYGHCSLQRKFSSSYSCTV